MQTAQVIQLRWYYHVRGDLVSIPALFSPGLLEQWTLIPELSMILSVIKEIANKLLLACLETFTSQITNISRENILWLMTFLCPPGTISQETADIISISSSTLEHLSHLRNTRHSETLTSRKEEDEKPSHSRERRALRSNSRWPNATIPFTFDTGTLSKSHSCSRGNFHFSATNCLL